MDRNLWTLLVTVLAMCSASPNDREYFPWCGERLNPREQGKAMRIATESMHACKSDIIRLNLSPFVVQEAQRLCIMFRICFSYAGQTNETVDTFRQSYIHCIDKILHVSEVLNPELFNKYRANATKITEAATRCSYHLIPQDYRYTLVTFGYFKNFISG
ncbi:uncharacterized protein LOC144144900 [Haemaphysalis longicornis]